MTLRCLFVDFNSYFASVEQYDCPQLRQRPVAVVPVMAPSTCCIAASYEAKAFGVKTGTPVWEALQLCPDLVLQEARPARYIELHHLLMAAIEDCIPHGKAESIDEVPCYLIGRERERSNAVAIAARIKQTLIDRGFSPAIRCSIGIAPNRYLAKTASDMHKPDGVTVLEAADLPQALHRLELRDLCGIGPGMEQRLHAAGINTVEQLCSVSRKHLRQAWGSVEGERFWLHLRGLELPARTGERASVGHSHVLGPELRNYAGMRAVLFKLLAKAAMRLRHEGFRAGALSLRIRFVGAEQRYERDVNFAPVDDTPTLLHLLAEQLHALEQAAASGRWNPRRHPPLSVAVTLTRLEAAASSSQSLLPSQQRAHRITSALDTINRRYGNNTVYLAAMHEALVAKAAPMRIPFSKIPDSPLEADILAAPHSQGSGYELWLQRERQYKVLAETAHRSRQRPASRVRKIATELEPPPVTAIGAQRELW